MQYTFTEKEESFRRELLEFLEKELPENWNSLSPEGHFSEGNLPFTKSMAKKLAEKGWLTVAWPEEYGGQGRSIMEQLIYREEMTYQDVPGTDLGTGAISWVGPTLMIAGTHEQRKEHLPRLETVMHTGALFTANQGRDLT